MAAVEDDVEALSRAILAEARAEIDEIKNGADSAAQATLQRAQAEADRERKTILDQAEGEAARWRSQATAAAQLKARSTELQERETLLQKVFTEALRRVPAAPKRPDYAEVVLRLLREGLTQLRVDEAVIRADAAALKNLTKEVLDGISQDMKVKLSLGKTLESGTGVLIQTVDGHLHFDNTLETRLARLKDSLRPSVYKILMGEAE